MSINIDEARQYLNGDPPFVEPTLLGVAFELLGEIERLRGLVREGHGVSVTDHDACSCGQEMNLPDCSRCNDFGSVTGPGGWLVVCPKCLAPAFAAHVDALLNPEET